MSLSERVIRSWDLICPPERQAMKDLAIASLSMSGFVLKDVITAYFEAYSPGWAELRRDTWVAAWGVIESTITIGETEYEVYLADQVWMFELVACIFDLECPDCPVPSLILAGFSPPVDIDFCL